MFYVLRDENRVRIWVRKYSDEPGPDGVSVAFRPQHFDLVVAGPFRTRAGAGRAADEYKARLYWS